MAKFNKQQLIQELEKQIQLQLDFAQELTSVNEDQVLRKPTSNSWNAIECLEHMSKSMQVYTHQLDSLELHEGEELEVAIGWLGRYFTNGTRPKNGKITNKIKTMKSLKPQQSNAIQSINEFRNQLENIKHFLVGNKNNLWKSAKVKSALGAVLKFNIAEALSFVLAHNERHILQAQKAMEI